MREFITKAHYPDGGPTEHDELCMHFLVVEDLNKLIRKQMKAISAVMELAKPNGYESTEAMYWKELIRNSIREELG